MKILLWSKKLKFENSLYIRSNERSVRYNFEYFHLRHIDLMCTIINILSVKYWDNKKIKRVFKIRGSLCIVMFAGNKVWMLCSFGDCVYRIVDHPSFVSLITDGIYYCNLFWDLFLLCCVHVRCVTSLIDFMWVILLFGSSSKQEKKRRGSHAHGVLGMR